MRTFVRFEVAAGPAADDNAGQRTLAQPQPPALFGRQRRRRKRWLHVTLLMLVELLLLLLRREHRRQTLAVCQQAVGHKLVRGRRHRRGVGGTEQLVEDGLLGPGDAEGRHSVVDDVRHIL